MAAWRSTTPLETPRFRRRLVRMAKKPSRALSQTVWPPPKSANASVCGRISFRDSKQTGRSWRELEGPTRMTPQPRDHLGLFVRGVVVVDGVDRLAGLDLALDGVREADELLMPVPLHAAADDLALQDVEGGEQGGRAVALVVVGHGSGAALLHRQARLAAIQG